MPQSGTSSRRNGLPKSEALPCVINEMHARRTGPAASSEAIRLGVRLERAPAWERLAAFRLSTDSDMTGA